MRNEGWQLKDIEEADWFGGGTTGGSGSNRTVYMSTNYDEILKYTSSRSALDYVLHSTHFFHKVWQWSFIFSTYIAVINISIFHFRFPRYKYSFIYLTNNN